MRSRIGLVTKNILSQVLGTAIVLSFTIIGTRFLSVADFGELRFVMTVLPLLVAFSLPGFDSIVLRSSSLRLKIPLLRIFITRSMAAAIGSLAILIALILHKENISDTLTFFLLTTAILLPFFETATGARNYLLGRGLKNRGINLQLTAKSAGLILALFFFGIILATKIEVYWIYPAWMLATIIPTLAVFARVVLKQNEGQIRARKSAGDINIVQAAMTTVAGLVYTLAFSLDKLFVRSELGAEQLALYAVLVMGPQELTKFIDATIPIFYRELFIKKNQISRSQLVLASLFLAFVMTCYSLGFYVLSGIVFGKDYTYPFLLVLLSSLLIPGQAFEYFNTHRIFAYYGASGTFFYSVCGLALTAFVVFVALAFGHVAELILALVIKQLTLPPLFLFFYRKVRNAV